MKVIDFLSYIRGLDVNIWVDGKKLSYSAPEGVMTSTLKAKLAEYKPEIVAFLRQNHLNQDSVSESIPSVSRKNVIPQSFAQQRLWFLAQLFPNNPFYNIPMVISIKGLLNPLILEKSLNEIIDRHEVFRTNFDTLDGQPIQNITATSTLSLKLQNLSSNQQEVEIQKLAFEESQKPFDLKQDLLIRAKLLQLKDFDHVLLLTMHHIISDGWSLGILIQELSEIYQAFSTASSPLLPKLNIQYADFAVWQRQKLQGEFLETQLTYWKRQLAAAPSILNLPTDRPRPTVPTFQGETFSFVVSPQLTTKLKALSNRSGTTLFMTLLTAFKVLLHRYTGETNIVVGSPVAGRNRADIEGLIGFFVNTLILHTDVSGNPTFRTLLNQVREVALGAYAHQDVPFEKLVDELSPTRDLSHMPLFQVAFALQDTPEINQLQFSGLTLNSLDYDIGTTRLDLEFHLWERSESIEGKCLYSKDLFDAATIELMVGRYLVLLEGIVTEPEQHILDLPLLTEIEQHKLLEEWNNTQVDYPLDTCLHYLFESQVEQTPKATAVVFEDQSLTYQELNEQANQLAHYLRNIGIGPESLVGICVERSLEMVIGLLGILKAGGAYMPIEPTYPQERLTFLIEDAQLSVLLTQQKLINRLPQFSGEVICLDNSLSYSDKKDNLVSGVTPDNAAYVIYTSGSTGKPKGVVNIHHGICNRLFWMQDAYQLTVSDSVLQKTPFSFDVSVWEFFWPLLNGARLIVSRPDGHKDSNYLVQLIRKQRVTTIHFVPPMLRVFLEEPDVKACSSLRQVICSGDVLPIDLQERFFKILDVDLHNLYGPTEAAIDVTFWKCHRDTQLRTVPIGRPIANTQIYLLADLKPVPVGIPGELHIGGFGLARGYLNKAELTAEKFIPSPFSQQPEARLYKTGDLARYLNDGTIEFLGRLDNQAKIRGFRIDPKEIETSLEEHLGINEAIVLAKEYTPGDKRLVAYLVPDREHALVPWKLLKLRSQGEPVEQLQYELHNGINIFHLNKNETDFSYREIFEEKVYFKHGITLNDGDCVFDVGANIGLFTLFAQQSCKNISVYAFEPLPPIFKILRLNTELYDLPVKLFESGLSGESKEENFTYYPHVSTVSGQFASFEEEREVIKTLILQQEQSVNGEINLSETQIDDMIAERLVSERFTCRLQTLSEIIDEHHLKQIDLLKIDVEKSELDVLSGIQEYDWSKIKQIVIEVHDIDNRLEQVMTLLKNHGYDVVAEQDRLFKDTGLYNVYAVQSTLTPISAHQLHLQPSEIPQASWASLRHLRQDLRNDLQAKLPEYMIPASFVFLDALPLTYNGKIDRKALPEPDYMSVKDTTYVAPRTSVEKTLAEIWADVLRLERVGIDDDFFNLGGDSILGLQIIARANQAGLRLVSKDLFQHKTIAELSTAVKVTQSIQAEQGLITGSLPLTPIQKWFFSQKFSKPDHWNQSLLLEANQCINADILAKAVTEIINHHDALRIRFEWQENGWQQINADTEVNTIVHYRDFSELPRESKNTAIQTTATKLHEGLNLQQGPLLQVALFHLGDSQPDQVLFIIHHLVFDGVSWHIFLEDLQKVYLQLISGDSIDLPPKTTSFQFWAKQLEAYAQSPTLEQDMDYWLALAKNESCIPVDYPQGINTEATARSINTTLTSAETTFLLQEVPKVFNVQMNDVLLTALAQVMIQWTNSPSVLIDIEGHGREAIFDHVDLSRTIGWFTTLFPVQLNLQKEANPGESLKSIKEQIRQIPNKGISYGLQRYLSNSSDTNTHIKSLPQSPIGFNYLGQFDQALSKSPLFTSIKQSPAPDRSLTGERTHHLSINAFIVDGNLQVNWIYSKTVYQSNTVEDLAQKFIESLKQLIQHCQLSNSEEYTPSDFPMARLGQNELDSFIAEIS